MILSRRNYDIAQGFDARGQLRSGVLEQSWRVSGATGAEIAALEAFRAEPTLQAVRASTFEIYGDADPPPHAWPTNAADGRRSRPRSRRSRVVPTHAAREVGQFVSRCH